MDLQKYEYTNLKAEMIMTFHEHKTMYAKAGWLLHCTKPITGSTSSLSVCLGWSL